MSRSVSYGCLMGLRSLSLCIDPHKAVRKAVSAMRTRLHGAQGERALRFDDLPDPRDGRLELLVLPRTQGPEGFDADLEATADPSLLPQAGHDAIDHEERQIPDGAARQHSLRRVGWNQALSWMTPDEVTVEVGQETHDLLRHRPGTCRLAREHPGMVAIDIDLFQLVGQLVHHGEGHARLHPKPLGKLAVCGGSIGGEIAPEDL